MTAQGAISGQRRARGARLGARRAALAALLAAVLIWAPAASAHPHVFVEHTVAINLGPDGLDGLQFTWTFDDMFSSMIVLTFDADKDKSISAAEAKNIEQKHFGHLKDFGYFPDMGLDCEGPLDESCEGCHSVACNGKVIVKPAQSLDLAFLNAYFLKGFPHSSS